MEPISSSPSTRKRSVTGTSPSPFRVSRDDAPVLLDRLERIRFPQLDRVYGLHVVMLVQQKFATAGPGHLRIQRGHATLVERLDAVGETAEALGDPVTSRRHSVQPVVGDAWKGTELFELFDEPSGVLLDVRVDGAG